MVLTDVHRAFLQLLMARHAVEATREADDLLRKCKSRFPEGTSGITVKSCVSTINESMHDLLFRIELVGSDADRQKYYVFVNKGAAPEDVKKPRGFDLFQKLVQKVIVPDDSGSRPGYVLLSHLLDSVSKKRDEIDGLCRDKWIQMDRDKVFLGVRGVAELDSEVRNSLPPCGLCQEIVVAGIQSPDGGYKHAWCVTGAAPPWRDDRDGDCDTSVTNTPESSGHRTPAGNGAGPSGIHTPGSNAATVGVVPRTGARGRKALKP